MNITILQNGFVTGDFLNPVAYAGEMNSREINIVHPMYDNSFYQLIILKEHRPYVLGIQDGKCILPPSLTDIACTLECQFIALRKSANDSSFECNCQPINSNDCSNMVFKSNKFNMAVAEGLNINGLTPIPPYEQLVDVYNNISKAKIAVEQAKLDNEKILESINEKITELQNIKTAGGSIANDEEVIDMIDDIYSNSKNDDNLNIASDEEIDDLLNDTFK